MTTAAQALAGLTQQGTGTQLAPLQAAAQPSIWSQMMEGVNTAFQDPLKMALMTGGLGLLSGQNPIQALTGAGGIYRQMMQGMTEKEQQDLANQMTERQIGLKEEELAFRKEDAEKDRALKEKELATRLEAAKVKAPKGVNDKLWKQATDLAKASGGTDQFGNPLPIEASSVYRYYRTLDPETTVNMPFGQREMLPLFDALAKNPEQADLIFAGASDLYGAEKMKRLRTRWEKLQQKAEETSEEAKPPVTMPQPTTPSAVSTPQLNPYLTGQWGTPTLNTGFSYLTGQ